jgi:hypothetical protein
MKMVNIPVGHLAISDEMPGYILYRTECGAVWIKNPNEDMDGEYYGDINNFSCDYEDLGKLEINYERVVTVENKISLSVV